MRLWNNNGRVKSLPLGPVAPSNARNQIGDRTRLKINLKIEIYKLNQKHTAKTVLC